jgi:hypothetical protein
MEAPMTDTRAALQAAETALDAAVNQYAVRTVGGVLVAADEQYPWVAGMMKALIAVRAALAAPPAAPKVTDEMVTAALNSWYGFYDRSVPYSEEQMWDMREAIAAALSPPSAPGGDKP